MAQQVSDNETRSGHSKRQSERDRRNRHAIRKGVSDAHNFYIKQARYIQHALSPFHRLLIGFQRHDSASPSQRKNRHLSSQWSEIKAFRSRLPLCLDRGERRRFESWDRHGSGSRGTKWCGRAIPLNPFITIPTVHIPAPEA